MDEFDDSIKAAQHAIEPRKDFVETTMKQIQLTKPHKKRGLKLWIPSAAVGAALVMGAVLLFPGLFSTNSQPTTTQSTLSSHTSAPATPAAGSDNASLQNDLDTINSSMNKEAGDQSAADSAINDNSQQIAVPTS